MRNNITNWYPFTPNSTILKIEHNIEQVGKDQYDYIILLGTLEHANTLFPGENPEGQLLKYAKNHLKQNGKILIATDNKMGITNYCETKQETKNTKKLNKKQIEELLRACDLKYYKFYYPLPNWENTNVIFTDKYLPNTENIVRNISLHKKEDFVYQSENKWFLDLIEQDKTLFEIFANSYLIECSRQEFLDNQIKFVSFSNMRKPQYSIQTVIQENQVYKTALSKESKKHIQAIKENIQILEKVGFYTIDSYQEDKIISKYQKGENLANNLVKQLKEGKKQEVIQLIQQFYQEIKEKLIKYPTTQNIFDQYEIKYEKQQIKNLTFTQYGLWDLIFQNVFYKEGKFFFYDQEWREEGVPIEYIFYRSIQYTKGLKENLKEEEIFNHVGITKQHIDLFLQLDNKLQEKTRDQKIWQQHTQGKTLEQLKEQINKEKQEREKILEDCKKLLNQKDARICFLEENMDTTVKLLHEKEKQVQQKENQIMQIKNSVSWKITKPLRIFRKKTLPKQTK